MIFLACPYSKLSTPIHANGGECYEVLAPGVFAASLARRPSVRLHLGHSGPMVAKVRPYEDERGLWFEYNGETPPDWSGFSVRFKPVSFVRIGPACFKLTEARLKHIALLQEPDIPVYAETRQIKEAGEKSPASYSGNTASKCSP